jgi:hypothetical protein
MSDKTHSVIPAADVAPTRMVLHPLVEKMLTTNPTPEALEKILGMQRDWENNEARRAYMSALVELKRDLPPFLLKDKTVDFTGATGKRTTYNHTSLAGAMDTVTPHLTAHGFALTWTPGTNDKGGVTVTAKLTHRLGHCEQASLTAPADMSGNKSSVQGIASTITLLQRYAALSLLGLASADMVDPTGEVEPTPEKVDTAKNMRAMADMAKEKKTKAQVEAYLGKPLNEWNAADLDKLRVWDAKPAIEAPVGKDEIATLKGLMAAYKLTPEDFGSIIETEIGRKPTGASDLKKSEFLKVVKAFEEVERDALTIKDGKIQRPPK